MTHTLTIPGRLSGLNEYIDACRRNPYAANTMKKRNEAAIRSAIIACLRGVKIDRPVYMRYHWIELDRRRDKDNIAFARKFVQDALVAAKVLHGDGWRHIVGFGDSFDVDSKNPRVEVEITEVSQ